METKAMLMVAVVLMAALGCTNGKVEDTPMAAKGDSAKQQVDSVKVDVQVNKVYDANGDLVGYDSTSTSVIEPEGGKAAAKGGMGK